MVLLLFASCSSQINGVLREGGSADLDIKASVEPRMSTLIRSLKAVLGNTGNDPVLDGPSISRSLATSPGVRAAALVNTGPSALEGTVSISRVEDFLASGQGTPFIAYSENNSGGKSSGHILISLDRKNVPLLLDLLSSEAIDYLSALMAPAVLDEDISRSDYLMLVGALYSQAIVTEIESARVLAEIEFPGPITTIRGGTAEGSHATFDIPLLDLLVLEKPLSWEVSW